jgi:MbtH protein
MRIIIDLFPGAVTKGVATTLSTCPDCSGQLQEIPMSFGDDKTVFDVVMNEQDQYSIWPSYKPLPNGWSTVGQQGLKAECLAYIEAHWTDMRPRSLREALAARVEGIVVA